MQSVHPRQPETAASSCSSLGRRVARARLGGTVLLALLAGGIASVVLSRFVSARAGEVCLWAGVTALTLCLVALSGVQRRLGRALDPRELDDFQQVAAGSARALPPLWDRFVPVLALVERLLDASSALSATLPWLGRRIEALRANEVAVVVRALLAVGPDARQAMEDLGAAIEDSDLPAIRLSLDRLRGAAEALQPALDAFSPPSRESSLGGGPSTDPEPR